MNRRNNAISPTGLYRCEVLDSGGVLQSLYIGVYGRTGGEYINNFMHSHSESCIGNPTFPADSLSYSISSRTLSCVSTGGPASTVSWRKDSVPITSSSYTQSQIVVDTETATYHNLLSINSSNIRDYIGIFICRVNNSRGRSTEVSTIINR